MEPGIAQAGQNPGCPRERKPMSTLLKRLLAVGTAATLALTMAVQSAQAAPDGEAAAKAAAYLATQIGEADHLTSDFGNEGITADAVLALEAVHDDAYAATISRLVAYLKAQAPAYTEKSPEGAAKLALVALAVGEKPQDFGGVDLIADVTGGVKPDGSFGAYPGPFAQSLGIIALKRSGQSVPESMLTWLVAQQDSKTGGFGYEAGQPADADNTGMALLGLTAADSPAVASAKSAAADWATKNQATDGSWTGYSPVNSTAVMGMALSATGADVTKAVSWTAGQQLADGSLPNAGKPDVMATAQGVLLLAGVTYLTPPSAETPWLTWALAGAAAAVLIAFAAMLLSRRRKARA